MRRYRLRKCPSEGTLVLAKQGQNQCFEDSDHSGGETVHLPARRMEDCRHTDGDLRSGKFPKTTFNGMRNMSTNAVDGWAATAAVTMANNMADFSTKDHRPPNSSCFANECEQSVDPGDSSDHSDLDRFDLPLDDRTTLSRIGSQLALQLPVNLGISERKRLLCNLSETVDANEAIILHHGAAISLPYAASMPINFQSSSFSPTGLQDLPHVLSRRNFEEDAVLRSASSWDLQSSCRGDSPNYQQGAELCLRLNHARQTLSFVNAQAAKYSSLGKAELNVWEALDLLDELPECDTTFPEAPETEADLPLKEHCFQTAEACRSAHPNEDWLHLLGLIHDLGKLLSHKRIGAEPPWAVFGESFPVGCRFDSSIACHHYFSVNPDRRRKQYCTDTGIYNPGVGLASVYMSWSAPEYLYMLLLLNETNLPPVALFLARYQKFLSLESSMSYQSLMSDEDLQFFPWLQHFRELSAYKRKHLPERLERESFKQYYSSLLEKYIPGGTLKF